MQRVIRRVILTNLMLNQRIIILFLGLLALNAVQSAEIGNRPASCTLKSMDGADSYDFQQFQGKVVYVDFWASWCPSCAKSFPFLNELQHDLKGRGLQILGVNLDEVRDDAVNFLNKFPAHFTVVVDSDQRCAEDFDVQAMPSSYLIDRNGIIRHVHLGFRGGETKELRELIEQLLAESAKES